MLTDFQAGLLSYPRQCCTARPSLPPKPICEARFSFSSLFSSFLSLLFSLFFSLSSLFGGLGEADDVS